MKDSKLGYRYAKALYQLAVEADKIEEVKTDLQLLLELDKTDAEFHNFICSPVISLKQKKNFFEISFASKFNKITYEFLLLIVSKSRELYLNNIGEQFLNLYYENKKIKKVLIETVVKLNDDTKTKIINKIKAHTGYDVLLEEKINPDLIGGLKITYDDKQYDASIAKNLKELKQQFSINIYEKGF